MLDHRFTLRINNLFEYPMTANGETDLKLLLKTLKPTLNEGDYVFCVLHDLEQIEMKDFIMVFNEGEGKTVIMKKEVADRLKLEYSFISSWITLTVHSSLAAVGLTASVSKALSEERISCNVVAAFYHDHIFVDRKDAERSMNILARLSH
jgi:hypothetical protein